MRKAFLRKYKNLNFTFIFNLYFNYIKSTYLTFRTLFKCISRAKTLFLILQLLIKPNENRNSKAIGWQYVCTVDLAILNKFLQKDILENPFFHLLDTDTDNAYRNSVHPIFLY